MNYSQSSQTTSWFINFHPMSSHFAVDFDNLSLRWWIIIIHFIINNPVHSSQLINQLYHPKICFPTFFPTFSSFGSAIPPKKCHLRFGSPVDGSPSAWLCWRCWWAPYPVCVRRPRNASSMRWWRGWTQANAWQKWVGLKMGYTPK